MDMDVLLKLRTDSFEQMNPHLDATLACLDRHLELAKVVQDELVAKLVRFHEFVLLPIDDGDLVPVFFEAFGDVGADEARSAADADFGTIAWGENKCFVFGHRGIII